MVTDSLAKKEQGIDLKMKCFQELQGTGRRRPQTAEWKIPKTDTRRQKYSKSAQEIGYSKEIQSPASLCHQAFSFENNSISQVNNLPMSNGTPSGSYKSSIMSVVAPHIDGKLPLIPSSNDFSKCNMLIDGSPVYQHHNGNQSSQTYFTSIELKTPWYISILHEKERNLLKLGEEINRLSKYEVYCMKKDNIIDTLKQEIVQLQNELHQTLHTRATMGKEDTATEHDNDVNILHKHEKSVFEEYPAAFDIPEEAEGSPSSYRHPVISPEADLSAKSLSVICPEADLSSKSLSVIYPEADLSAKSLSVISPEDLSATTLSVCSSEIQKESHLIQIETESLTEDRTAEEHVSEFENNQHVQEHTGGYLDVPDDFHKLTKDLQEELDKIKKDYEMSKGVIYSLQRLVSFQESQVRKAECNQENLKRELEERGIQLQAMSTKFSSLREERKHEEMMAAIEKENYDLRELVSELKSEMANRNVLIADFKNEVQKLKKAITDYQTQIKKCESERSEIQSKAEDLVCSEQQVKVILEWIQSRFERFRSKILQAAYSAPGAKPPQAEITDNEILEVMQKIITDRSDFHQLLKQKGVRVPSLFIYEIPATTKQTSMPKKKSQ